MKHQLEKVQGTEHLFRDPTTRVVLNTNESEFQNARLAKVERKRKLLEQEQMLIDVDKLKSDMQDIKLLLQKMVEKHG